MMDILMSETCWGHKKWNKIASDIKLVFYSSNVVRLCVSELRLIVPNAVKFGVSEVGLIAPNLRPLAARRPRHTHHVTRLYLRCHLSHLHTNSLERCVLWRAECVWRHTCVHVGAIDSVDVSSWLYVGTSDGLEFTFWYDRPISFWWHLALNYFFGVVREITNRHSQFQ